jgi:hypothetical protein
MQLNRPSPKQLLRCTRRMPYSSSVVGFRLAIPVINQLRQGCTNERPPLLVGLHVLMESPNRLRECEGIYVCFRKRMNDRDLSKIDQSGEICWLAITKADVAWNCTSLEISLRRRSNFKRPRQVKLQPSTALSASCVRSGFVSLATGTKPHACDCEADLESGAPGIYCPHGQGMASGSPIDPTRSAPANRTS